MILVAATSGGDVSGFGLKGGGSCHGSCYGTVTTGCSGSCHGSTFLGMRSGGLFGGKHHKHGCHGSCHGTYTAAGCTGTVAPAPVVTPVPVVPAPTGCTGSMYTPPGCTGSMYYSTGCSGCHGGGFLGLRGGGGLFGGKHHKGGCCGGTY